MISKRLHPASFSNVNAQLAQKANVAQEAWIEATLLNSWSGVLRYKKSTTGCVYVEFNIVAGTLTALTNIATLPVGYRVTSGIFSGIRCQNSSTSANCDLRMNDAGNIQVPTSPGISAGNTVRGTFSFQESA